MAMAAATTLVAAVVTTTAVAAAEMMTMTMTTAAAIAAMAVCHKPPRYVPYKCTYVPYDGTFGTSEQGQMLDL